MAVNHFHLLTSGSTVDGTSYVTASITPTTNRLVLAAVYSQITTGAPVIPTLTGNGLTWVQVDTDIDGANERRVTVFRALGASPTAGAVTISFGAETQLGCLWSISEYSGIDTSGTNGSGALVQSTTGKQTATTLTLTLGAFGSVNNSTYGAFGENQQSTFTAGTNFTLIGQAIHSTPSGGIVSEFRQANDTTVDITASVSGRLVGIAAEIKAAPTGGATVTPATIATTTALPQATPFTGSPPPSSGLQYVNSANGSDTGGTNVTATFAAAPASGNLLVAVASVHDLASTAWDTPAGWTAAVSATSVSTDLIGTKMFYRLAPGAVTAFTFSTSTLSLIHI